MIPTSSENVFLDEDFEVESEPSLTYAMNLNKKTIQGYVDDEDAIRQAIYKILNTERYEYPMYSWDYGIELDDLYGRPIFYVVPELERRITEALTADDRIDNVINFNFDTSKKGIVHVTFTAVTSTGDEIDEETEVEI